MSRYRLPDLSYDYGALEPHLSGKVMELHHDQHHRKYVEGANEAIDQLLEARHQEHFERIAALEHSIAFNVSGHVLHSLFWQNLSPRGGGAPQGPLAEALGRDFGSFEHFKKQLTAVASSVMGSGWAALMYDPVLRRLGITQIHDHQSEVSIGAVPLMVLDAWEHAYYLQYQTQKAKYVDALWNLWNWEDIAGRLARAQALDLGLVDTAQGPSAPSVPLPH